MSLLQWEAGTSYVILMCRSWKSVTGSGKPRSDKSLEACSVKVQEDSLDLRVYREAVVVRLSDKPKGKPPRPDLPLSLMRLHNAPRQG